MKKDSIHIALAFDQNFITPFYVLLTSIFSNNKQNSLVFHTIADGLEQRQKDEILFFVAQNKAEMFFYSINKDVVHQFTLSVDSPHITSATYYRLYFPELVNIDNEYLIYLDTDIIVLGDLAKLYHTPIGSLPVAAVADPKVRSRPDLGVEKDGEYFNAGVLLINLKQWRDLKVTERATKFVVSFPEKILLADQDALNHVLAGNWYKLDQRYNITFYDVPRHLRKNQFESFVKDKVIIHYTTQNKPWLLTCTNRLRFLYFNYLQKSPHKDLNVYADEALRKRYGYKLLKRRLKEFLIDLGIKI